MTLFLIGHLVYLAVTVPVVAVLALRFAAHGRDLLAECGGSAATARATSGALAGVALLLDVGLVLWLLSTAVPVADPVEALSRLALRTGLALVLLGAVHLVHLWILVGVRNGRRDRENTAARLDLAARQQQAWMQAGSRAGSYAGARP